MKRLLISLSVIICYLALLPATAGAQPSWVKKATKSVFTLKTFAADGSLIASSNGFFVGSNGEAISNFTPFKGAARAIVIDAGGKEWPVSGIMGANDMYDVVKFRVEAQKTQPLVVASAIAPVGSNVWFLPYRDTKNVRQGAVRKAEKFMNAYAYYTVALQISELNVSCPLLNDNGEVLGLMQQPASAKDSLSYAVSALFADSLKITGLSLNDLSLRQTQIRLELPDNMQEALLMMYMANSAADSATYVRMMDEFIRKFPNAYDGYVYRAQFAAGNGHYADAERDMQQALKVADKKEEAHYAYARIIYNKEIFQSDKPFAAWSLDKALEEVRTANTLQPSPTYSQMEANILFAQKKYDEAYTIYQALTKTNLSGAEIWFSAARCKELQKDTTAYLALLDSTMSTFSKPYLKEAAPYLWTRANARMDAGKYREAVVDMNDYEQLMAANVNARFYYIRHQAEIGGHLYQQALNDITRAIQLEPKEVLYQAEKASLQIRVGLYDDAITTARECIATDGQASDGYLFLGLAQCLKGNKKEGLPNLQKAKELGDPQAESLIEKYAK
jgi:predicted Zn-dependent protease